MNRETIPTNRTLPQTSRRDLLKLGGAVAAGSVLAGVSVPWVHAGEDNTIRLALIGCGGRGRGAVGDAFSVAAGPMKLHAMADLTDQRVQTAHGVLEKHFGDRVEVPADRRFAGFDAYRHAIDCLRPGDVAMLTAYAYCRPSQIEYWLLLGVGLAAFNRYPPRTWCSNNRPGACGLFFIGRKMIRRLQLTATQALAALIAALLTEAGKWG
jgi:hypothetical protein